MERERSLSQSFTPIVMQSLAMHHSIITTAALLHQVCPSTTSAAAVAFTLQTVAMGLQLLITTTMEIASSITFLLPPAQSHHHPLSGP
jgi:hypothetical protein